MDNFFNRLFDQDFMPHGHCYFWKPEVFWTHAISDSIIALAYFTIPLSLVYIMRTRKDVKYRWLVFLFAVFILGCGATHVMGVVTIWNPVYRLDGLIKAITALASIGTAIMLVRITPAVILMPSTEKWQQMNEDLKNQIRQLQEKDKTIESMQDFQYLANAMPQLVWIANDKGRIAYYNSQWTVFTGIPVDELKDWNFASILHPDDIETVNAELSKAIETGILFEIQYRLKNKDGEYRWFLARALPIPGKNGESERWFGTATDIHDSITYQEEMSQKNKELIKINNDLDNFVYIASHDLKAPVLNMEGLMTVIQNDVSDKLSDKSKHVLNLMSGAIDKLKRTIQDLTEIAKIQKNINAEVSEVSFEEIVNEVKSDFISIITASGVEINTSFQVESTHFSKINLRSILYNLISNAIKYRKSDVASHVIISTYVENDFLILEVKDNGLGIDLDENKRSKIFSMFRRFHTHVEGSGVGLYIVKRIVENAGGRIEVDSKVDEGTTFKVYFPKED